MKLLLSDGDGQVDDGDIWRRDPEGHSGQLSAQAWDDLSDGLGSSGRGRDNVLWPML